MLSKFVEVTNNFNWGKFLVCQFSPEEWAKRSEITGDGLLKGRGWTLAHLWVMDLQTGEGAYFRPGGHPVADLQKHQIWVCPMYQLFLAKLYEHKDWCADITRIPDLITLTAEESKHASALYGFRREGPDQAERERVIRETARKPKRKKP